MTPPVPSIVLRSRRNSFAIGTSSCPAGRIGIDIAAGDHAFHLAPAGNAARVLEDDLGQRRSERQLVEARADDVTRHAEDRRPGALLGSERAKPVDALFDDVRNVGKGLHVVDRRRHSEGAVLRGKGRLLARLTLLALERFEQSGLFPADVGARASRHMDVVAEARAHDVVAEIPLRVGLGDRALHLFGGIGVFAPDVDEGRRRSGRPGRDQDAFEHLMRSALEQDPVLERSGLGLVGVADQVLGAIRVLGHERPLQARRETRASATLQARGLDELDHFVGRHLGQGFARGPVAADALVAVDGWIVLLAEVLGEIVGHVGSLEHSATPYSPSESRMRFAFSTSRSS